MINSDRFGSTRPILCRCVLSPVSAKSTLLCRTGSADGYGSRTQAPGPATNRGDRVIPSETALNDVPSDVPSDVPGVPNTAVAARVPAVRRASASRGALHQLYRSAVTLQLEDIMRTVGAMAQEQRDVREWSP